ncbi:amidohydrolase family protein [Mesorhizobium sp. M0768]|uniref:amidohydrolase family protein n=1 Tax=Mesorhizobium sp. M0768 TaxID=2956996 RepID=UPI00333D31F0
MTNSDRQIAQLIEETPFVDTHEHLVEESQRISGSVDLLMRCDDWTYLFSAYICSDLASAGMPATALQSFLGPNLSGEEKYKLVAPFWNCIRHTGYAQALLHTFRGLYGEEDLTSKSVPRIAEKYRDTVRPGFYPTILRRANIESCQVNSVQRIFMETEQPTLLLQDLSILPFCRCSAADLALVHAETGRQPTTLEEWLDVIDHYFATYGHKAVAVKCQIAYSRPLDFAPISKPRASRLFARHVGVLGHPLGSEDFKALQDFLFRYCVDKAGECGLPVKLHTGILEGSGFMELARIRDNASDLCRLLQDFPDTRFVLMHIGYPYQHEFIAVAKHYPNAFIDMCWAWIINPAASVRFLKEFLMSVPANKIFTFGGDYVAVEPIYGHALMARRGIALAISQLVAEGWIAQEETPELINGIMRGNALEFFPNAQRHETPNC